MAYKPTIIGTGLSGLVGSRAVELLKDQYTFQNFDLTTGVDITNKESIKKAVEESSGEVMLHLAAFTNVNACWDQRGDKKAPCFSTNVQGTRNVAQYCAESGKYLVHISTDFVFSGNKSSAYSEEDPPHPIEWYGKTKLLAEEEVRKTKGNHSIVRIAFPFRAEYEPKLDIVRNIKKKLEEKTTLPMFTDQIITPTFIDDIANALKIIIHEKPQGIFHVVGSTSLSPYDLAKKIAETFGLDQEQIQKGSLAEYLKTSRRPYQKTLIISNQKIRDELGIKMSTIDSALSEMKKQLEK